MSVNLKCMQMSHQCLT